MKEFINNQRDLIVRTLKPLINSDYALLDVPNHPNIGDNLIWAGELAFLKEHIGYKCKYSANVWNFKFSEIENIDTILFHGGGNWGDLYRECQMLRLDICNKYKNKRIIVFPQTVCYTQTDLMEFDNKILNEHPDLYVCVRDNASYNTLMSTSPKYKVLLLPDMAFFLSFESRVKIETKKDLLLKRTDQECNSGEYKINSNCYETKDWPTFSNIRIIQMLSNKIFDIKNKLSVLLQNWSCTSKLVDPEYGLNNKKNRDLYIQQGVDFLLAYDKIFTTRLHGMILGLLLGKDIYILDNKYGKCTDYYNTWLKDVDKVHVK